MSSNQHLSRIKKLQKQRSSDLYFVENPTDLFYLTGMKFSLGHLLVDKSKARLFVDGRYFEAASKKSPIPVSPLEEKHLLSFMKGKKRLTFDGDNTSYTQFQKLKKMCTKAKLKMVSDPMELKTIRLIKDAGEIRLMKKSAKFAWEAYQYIKKKLKEGVTEIELANELKIYCLKKGAEGMSFEPIIAFGKNSALPHHHPGKTKLKKNDIVLFDLGVVLDDYCSDMTRVVFVGKQDPKLKKIYEVNYAAQRAALSKCKPGVALKELDSAARKVMAKEGLEEYFVHTLGHGVGLDIHEYPRLSKTHVDRNLKLQPGMAVTIEPGIYLPGKGGVRYEDTIIITETGYTNLYKE